MGEIDYSFEFESFGSSDQLRGLRLSATSDGFDEPATTDATA